MKSKDIVVLCLLACGSIAVNASCPGQYPLVPHGVAHGDTSLGRVDDGASPPILLSPPIPLFGRNEAVVYVGSNGYFSFGLPSYLYYYNINSYKIVAPFWADIDIRVHGNISYRDSLDESHCIQQIIEDEFLEPNFQVRSSLVATYKEVRRYIGTANKKTNSFQVVLVSDGQLSFVFFSYGDIQWGGNAFIGFNLGERRNFSVPGSLTASIVDVETRSNVGVPGLFVYRVDQMNVIEPGGSFNQDVDSFTVKKFSDCSQREQIQDDVIRDMVELLSTEYGFEPLGRLKEFPATSCEEISQTYFRPGLYWITHAGMEPGLQYCDNN